MGSVTGQDSSNNSSKDFAMIILTVLYHNNQECRLIALHYTQVSAPCARTKKDCQKGSQKSKFERAPIYGAGVAEGAGTSTTWWLGGSVGSGAGLGVVLARTKSYRVCSVFLSALPLALSL